MVGTAYTAGGRDRHVTLKSFVRKVHLYMAFVTGIPLALVGISGAGMAAADLWNGTTAVKPRAVQPTGSIRPLAELLDAAPAAYPPHSVVGVALPRRPDLAYDVVLRDGRRVFVDPYTATVVDSQYLTGTFRRAAYQLHATLMAGDTGKTIVGISTLVSMALAITGLYLWWPRGRWSQALTMKWNASWKRFNFDLHNTVGFYSSLVLLLLALSGAIIAYDEAAKTWLGGADKTGVTYRSTPIQGASRIPPAEALRIADAALPGAQTGWLSIPQNPRGVYSIFKRFPEDPSPGMSRVFIDQFSGAVLAVKNTREARMGQRILDLNFPIHTGQIFGVPGQVVALVVSLLLAGQLVTGLLIWWQRRTPRSARKAGVGTE
jgi:uncharacterized iron-regulated membrane protein